MFYFVLPSKQVDLLGTRLIFKVSFVNFSCKSMKLKSNFEDRYYKGTAVPLTYTNKVVFENVFDQNTGFMFFDFCLNSLNLCEMR